MKVAYWRQVIGLSPTGEWTNGCPTLLIESEPAFVVQKLVTGKLAVYSHYAMRQYHESDSDSTTVRADSNVSM